MNEQQHLQPVSLPQQFADRRVFVLAILVPRDGGRVDKVPVSVERRLINALDPSNWLTGSTAAEQASRLGCGIGIVISEGSDLACIDIDKAWDGKMWAPHVSTMLAHFPGAYVEVSQSGKGLHIIFSRTEIPPHKTRNGELHVECYTRARFIYLTGTHARGDAKVDLTQQLTKFIAEYLSEGPTHDKTVWTTDPVEEWRGDDDDDELIGRAKRTRGPQAIFGSKAAFDDLWTANSDKLAAAFPAQSQGQTWDESAADLALASHLAFWTGKNCERIERLMRKSELARAKWDAREDYMRRTILRACSGQRKVYSAKGGAQQAAPAASEEDLRPVILLQGGQLNQYAKQAEELLSDATYVRGGNLVRVGRASEFALTSAQDTKRDLEQAVCVPASAAWLRRTLMERARFFKYDKRSNEWEPKDCPKELSENISDQKAWTTLRPLKAISSVPILRPDMSVWLQPGYDPVTAVFYQPTIKIPPLPLTPTREDGLQALGRLSEPFNEFPFAAPESHSVFISHVIASVVRASFSTCPIYLYTSPMAGTGKTLLADQAAVIAQGIEHPAKNPFSEDEELRKVLFASLLAGDAALTLDNLPNGERVKAPFLCQFLTSGTVGDRILGASETRKIPNRCTVVLNGNNISPAGDLVRRSLICRLDVNSETARGRNFRIKNLRAYVSECRAQLIVDAITVVRAYAFAGRPEVAPPLESFEEWSQLARDPLIWLGMTDPVMSQEAQSEDDVTPLRSAFAAIAAATFGQEFVFTTAQLAALTVPQTPTLTAVQKANALREALLNAGCEKPAEKLGYWLREHTDRVAGGWKLLSGRDTATNTTVWRLRSA